jgi:hypothetical protein
MWYLNLPKQAHDLLRRILLSLHNSWLLPYQFLVLLLVQKEVGLHLSRRRTLAIEVKRTMAPKIDRGFPSACADLNPEKRFYVYPGTECFPLDDRTDAIGVVELAKALQSVK